jgi:hypothetical protein
MENTSQFPDDYSASGAFSDMSHFHSSGPLWSSRTSSLHSSDVDPKEASESLMPKIYDTRVYVTLNSSTDASRKAILGSPAKPSTLHCSNAWMDCELELLMMTCARIWRKLPRSHTRAANNPGSEMRINLVKNAGRSIKQPVRWLRKLISSKRPEIPKEHHQHQQTSLG